MNCSSQCDSALCFIHAGVNRQEGLEIMQRLCGLGTVITAINVMSEQFSSKSVELVPHIREDNPAINTYFIHPLRNH